MVAPAIASAFRGADMTQLEAARKGVITQQMN
jgi:hypothetical protein